MLLVSIRKKNAPYLIAKPDFLAAPENLLSTGLHYTVSCYVRGVNLQ